MAVSRIELKGRPMFTAYIRDITERRRGERTRSELAAVVDSSSDAIVGKTLDGIIVSWNGAAERLYGYTAADAIGRHVYILVPADKLDELPQTLEAVKRGESMVNFETVRLRKDGQRIAVTVTESPIRNERGHITGISSIARDITERKKLEKQLLQSQKMEAVGRLAGGVAHDFNNLLTAILGYSELLLRARLAAGRSDAAELLGDRKGRRNAPRRSRASSSRSAASRCSQPKVVRPQRRRRRASRRCSGASSARTSSSSTLRTRTLGRVKADPAQIEQVIMNLAVNARDAMPRGGKLTIETRERRSCDDAYCRAHSEMPAGDYVDAARSATPARAWTRRRQARIFEPFFTTKDKGKGTGLGLATCYGIVKQSGGYIVVESVLGQGSTFQIYLPRVNDRGIVFPVRAPSGRLPHGSETILLVEDEPSVRTLAAQALRRLGYCVIEAEDGDGARRAVDNLNGSKIDLLLADVVLPSNGGLDLMKLIERTQDGAKILFTSGYVKEVVCKKYDLPIGVPFLQKPFTPGDLARKVREIIES